MLTVALFFFSCEDQISILGFKNPKPKFNVSYVEIPIESSVLRIDSVVTDGKTGNGTNLIGQYTDIRAGKIKAQPFLQMIPVSITKLDATSVYDSVVFQARLNFYSYGITGNEDIRFAIHEITGDSLDRTGNSRYYYNSSLAYDQTPLGDAKINVDYASLKEQLAKEAGKQDTLLVRSKLSDDFGMRLFELAMNDIVRKNFIFDVKGLTLVPSGNNGIIGFNSLTGFSRVIVYYHTMENGAVKEKLESNFIFSNGAATPSAPNFTNISGDLSGGEFSGLTQSYQSTKPASGLRMVQSGYPVITKLDLKKFYDFADTVGSIIVNSADLIISDVESPAGSEPHGAFIFQVFNNQNDVFANARNQQEIDNIAPYLVNSADNPKRYVYVDGKHFFVRTEGNVSGLAPAYLSYNSETKQFSGFMTLFVQSLSINRINENRIRFLAMYPGNPSVSTAVNHTLFNADNVKLRVYYTKPTLTSNPN